MDHLPRRPRTLRRPLPIAAAVILELPPRLAACFRLGLMGILIASCLACTSMDASKTIETAKLAWNADELGEDWAGYFINQRGEPVRIEEPIRQYPDFFWGHTYWTKWEQPKTRIAVMPFQNRVPLEWKAQVPVSNMEAYLASSLQATNRFELVEREHLDVILREQSLVFTGRISPASASRIGRLLGVQTLVFGEIHEYQTGAAADRASGIPLPGNARLSVGRSVDGIALSVRVVDVTSGRVLTVFDERASRSRFRIGLTFGQGSKIESERQALVSRALQVVLNRAAYRIAMFYKDTPWQGTVARVEGMRVFINAGSAQGLQQGMVLSALSVGNELIDPSTGLTLGPEVRISGTLDVVAVQETYAEALISDGCEDLKAGDLVEYATPIP